MSASRASGSGFLVLLLGELRLQLRQPLALTLMVLFPILAGPGALLGLEGMLSAFEAADRAEEDHHGPGEDARRVLSIAAPAELAEWLVPEDALRIAPDGRLPAEGPVDDVVAEVSLAEGEATIRYRADVARSRAARDRVEEAIARVEDDQLAARLRDAGAPITPAELVVVERRDVSTARERSGHPLGIALTPLLLLTLSIAALYTAIDVITGEKERGTIETLLTSSADRRSIVVAKLAVVVLGTALSGWLLLGSLVAAQLGGFLSLPTLLQADADLLPYVPLLALATFLLALQIAGASVVLATWVPDYKAASMVSAPAMLLLLVPAGAGGVPVELGPLIAIVPIANVAVAIRELLSDEIGGSTLALVLVASALHAAASIAVALRLYGRESALLGLDDRAARRRLGFYGRDAAMLFVGVLVLFWFFGQTAQALDLLAGTVFSQIVLMAGVAVGAVAWLGLPVADTLSLRRPRGSHLVLGLIAGVLAPCVGSLVFVLQDPWLPTSRTFIEQMSKLALEDHPIWVPLVVFAVLPAVCEEVLFRGALLGLLRRSLAEVPRVLVVALAFGVMHLSILRLFPTAAIGLLATVAAVRSGNLYTAVVIHFVNNAVVITIGRSFGDDSTAAFGYGPVLLYAIGSVIAFGAVFAIRRPDQPTISVQP